MKPTLFKMLVALAGMALTAQAASFTNNGAVYFTNGVSETLILSKNATQTNFSLFPTSYKYSGYCNLVVSGQANFTAAPSLSIAGNNHSSAVAPGIGGYDCFYQMSSGAGGLKDPNLTLGTDAGGNNPPMEPWNYVIPAYNDLNIYRFVGALNNSIATNFFAGFNESLPIKENANFSVTITQLEPATNMLGSASLLVGPMAGASSVVLCVFPLGATWEATANASWLHLGTSSENCSGSTNLVFNFDANQGPTRIGTLTVAGLTLTVTQAAVSYAAANTFTNLDISRLNAPSGVAVDSAGSVYIANSSDNSILKWSPVTGTLTNLVSAGLDSPAALALDSVGNLYIADTGNNAIEEWSPLTMQLTKLVSTGLNSPMGVALDRENNVYIADTKNNSVFKWSPVTGLLTPLVTTGLNSPVGLAVDCSGNVYIAESGGGAISKWSAASGTLSTLVTSGLSGPNAVAVDGSGNVYFSDLNSNVIKEWSAASNTVSQLATPGLNRPSGVAVDFNANIYVADTQDNAIKELARAYVVSTTKTNSSVSSIDILPAVLPSTENLAGVFYPTSNQPWLTIADINNGVVYYHLDNNTNVSRTARLTLLGTPILITQLGVK